MTKKPRLLPILLASALGLLFLGSTTTTALAKPPAHAGGGGGGGGGDDGGSDDGGGDGGTLPNVRYEVAWLGTLGGSYSSALAANDSGEIVGTSRNADGVLLATRFTLAGPVDLNVEMADLVAARDDGPWTAVIARDINELGQITGQIRPSSGISHPFIYDPGDIDSGRPAALEILPQLYDYTTRGVAINNYGEIAGTYQPQNTDGGSFLYSPGGVLIDMGAGVFANEGSINDAGQITFWDNVLAHSWRYTPNSVLGDSGTFEEFPGGGLDINFFGDVAGTFRTETKSGKNKFVETIYRAATPETIEVLYEGSSATFPFINDDRDVCFIVDSRLVLYTDNQSLGLVELDPLVTGDDASVSKWLNANGTVPAELPNRDTTGFSTIAGRGDFGSGVSEGFILLPYLVQ